MNRTEMECFKSALHSLHAKQRLETNDLLLSFFHSVGRDDLVLEVRDHGIPKEILLSNAMYAHLKKPKCIGSIPCRVLSGVSTCSLHFNGGITSPIFTSDPIRIDR